MPMISDSVRRAVLTAGGRNAFTPLLTASTPVMAVQPLENACRISQRPAVVAAPCGACGGTTGAGFPPLRNSLDQAHANRAQKAADEQIGGNHEQIPRFTHAAQIDQRDGGEDAQTNASVCCSKLGTAETKRTDSGGDADGHHQDVVDNQRRGGQQRDILSQVLSRHRVGAAASRIGGDGLKVGNVDNDQQRNDAEADRDHVVDAQGAQRDQQRERGLRAVRRGAQRIQTEHSDARQRAEAFFAVLVRGERLAKQQIAERHR